MQSEQAFPVAYIAGRCVVLDVDIAIELQVPLPELERICQEAHVNRTAGALIDLTPTEKLVLAFQIARQGRWQHGETPARGFTATGLALLLRAYQTSEAMSNRILDMITGAYGRQAMSSSIH